MQKNKQKALTQAIHITLLLEILFLLHNCCRILIGYSPHAIRCRGVINKDIPMKIPINVFETQFVNYIL